MSNSAVKKWGKELSKGLISVKQLAENKIINEEEISSLNLIKQHLDIRIPHHLVSDILDKNDALRKQFVPSHNELIFLPEELDDPIGDEVWAPVEGITHRYPDRVLLKPTYMCAGYCRFCFRRYKVSHTEYNLKEETYKKAIHYVYSQQSIEEVILTGGDPLTLTDVTLHGIMKDLSLIKHVKVIRFHTRVPTLLPERVTPELIQILKQSHKSLWVAVHINHADEFKEEAKQALSLFVDAGIPVIMQSVLLKGVNDSVESLTKLFKTAVENRIKPYYLHYPDLAKGTKHFRVPVSEAISLVKNLRGKISGLCIPHFILDIPSGKGKIEINPSFSKEISSGLWRFESPLDGSISEIRYE